MKKRILKQSVHIILILSLLFSCLPLYATEGDPGTSVPTIGAEAAILIDAKTGEILFEKNSQDRHFPASITKLMTALLVIENLKPTDMITFSEDAIYGIERGSSHMGMRVGEQISVDQALRCLLLMSANEVANGLAEKVSGSMDNFAVAMTKKAEALGAKGTSFKNPHGLDDEQHYTTAYDMALIAKELFHNEYFLEIMKDVTYQIPPTNKVNEIRYLSQQHKLMNQFSDSKLYRSDVIGGKTGYTDIARHTLVTMAKQGDIELIAVIMKSDTKSGMYTDTTKLLDYGFNAYQTFDLLKENEVITKLPIYSVKSGKLIEFATCDIVASSNESVLVSKNIKTRDIVTNINVPEYLEMGIASDAIVGSIEYLHNNKVLAKSDLKISNINYISSPYTANQPEKPTLTFPISSFLILLILLLVILILLTLFIKRKRKRKFKHKKLKFSKTIK
ncbi:D-alanyl-D-alanine carboxypeptidase [Niameybacter massiliensis]|uniref:serine-type D-Ala-D-Ala carboxypeptidase n=1 Tax=Holtiella tumoricola TaxID=3018743 RepID=A0AA42J2E8_9FIRM|nr:D-alanyl-D-alanine carboxypeptidase family protein [Holtiella tumoricola]MDA3733637.1 D-alanyl-D-alanine carboxypeptidase [Holtiella tumoricola]